MKKYLLLSFLSISMGLTSCEKEEGCYDPQATVADFNQNFGLQYKQVGKLDSDTQPELVIAVNDLAYSICPANARCVAPDFVVPTLTITSATGQTQQITLPRPETRASHPNWIDSTSIRANGRRYSLYYVKWDVKRRGPEARKEDISVVLRMEKHTE